MSDAPLDVLVVGPSYCDLTFVGLPALPTAGRERFADALHATAGGSAITALALARLGRRVALLDDVGRDLHGQVIVDALERDGVATDLLRRDARPTAVTVVLPSDGDRAFVTHLPPDAADGPPDLAAALEATTPRWLHVAGTAPARAYPDLLALARGVGARVAFDPGWHDDDLDAPEVRALVEGCDALLPNRSEAARLAGHPDDGDQDQNDDGDADANDDGGDVARAALRQLAARRPGGVTVVKDGAAGAWGVAPGRADVAHAAVPPVPVVDATGAGDVFDAAFLDAWIDGVPLDDALYAGAAAGAAAVGRIGGATGAPTVRATRERSEP